MEGPTDVSLGWRKSSYSNNGGAGCVEVCAVPWRKSSYSSNGGTACVEVGAIPWRELTRSGNGGNGGAQCAEAGHAPGAVIVRDTTQHGTGPLLRVSAETWRRFTATLR